jgi:hypothetical protein
MERIPKIAYFYWGAKVLPYLRFMTFKSFLQNNPDWKIVLYIPVKLVTEQTWSTYENKQGVDTVDYMDRLADIGVVVKTCDMESIGFSNDLPEVTKSDILRIYLLLSKGGFWFDNDQVFFRPLSQVIPQTNHIAYFCWRRGGPTQAAIPKNGPQYHSIGALGAVPGTRYFKWLWHGIKDVLNTKEYQSCGSPYYGSIITDTIVTHNQNDIYNFDVNTFYPSRALPGMWVGATGEYVNQITPVTCSWHWYGGFPLSGEMQNKITEENYLQHDSIITWLIDKVNRGEAV